MVFESFGGLYWRVSCLFEWPCLVCNESLRFFVFMALLWSGRLNCLVICKSQWWIVCQPWKLLFLKLWFLYRRSGHNYAYTGLMGNMNWAFCNGSFVCWTRTCSSNAFLSCSLQLSTPWCTGVELVVKVWSVPVLLLFKNALLQELLECGEVRTQILRRAESSSVCVVLHYSHDCMRLSVTDVFHEHSWRLKT